MKTNGIGLSSPWITYVNELKALFEKDPEITINYSDAKPDEVCIFVEKQEKADALSKLIPPVKSFGNFNLRIYVVPANLKSVSNEELIHAAFDGNPVLETVMTLPSPFGDMTYGVFAKKVVQFQNDDMADPNGLESTLYENIARDVFDSPLNTFWCTSNRDVPVESK